MDGAWQWQPGARVGPYVLREKLGAGTMGAVFRALGPDGREVALKAMSVGGSELALKRFLRESQAQSAAGEHPNVLTIYGSGHDLGCPWIAVQLAGDSLQDRIDRYGALDAEEVLRIG